MRKWLKRAGIGFGSLVALLLLAVFGLYGFSSSGMSRTYDVPTSTLVIPTDSASIEHGRRMATAIGKCVECHTHDLGGGPMMDDPAFGRLSATNLTSGRGGVGSTYTDEDFIRALRHGVRPDGSPLLFMPSQEYTHMSDVDLASLIAYLRTVPPVDRETPKPKPGPIARMLYVTKQLPLVPAEIIDHSAPIPSPIPAGPTVEYGAYLARVGGCQGCHGENLAGGGVNGPPGTAPAANLTPAAIGSWTLEDFRRALREGTRPDGTKITPAMPFVYTAQMTDMEIEAVWAFLQTVPAVESPKK